MTVKDELVLISKGYSRAEIKEMKEREKLEAEPEPKIEEPKIEEPKVEEPKIEEVKVEEPKVEEVNNQDDILKENESLKAQLSKMQEENAHRDNSVNVDTRSDFEKGVEIFKNAF